MKAPHPVDEFEADVIANADHFTVFVQMAPGDRRKETCQTKEGAIALATDWAKASGRAILVYAVTPQGRQALVTTIR